MSKITLLTLIIITLTGCTHIDQQVCRHRVLGSFAVAYENGPAKVALLKPTSGEGDWHVMNYSPIDGVWLYQDYSEAGGSWCSKELPAEWVLYKWLNTIGEIWAVIEAKKQKNIKSGKVDGLHRKYVPFYRSTTGFEKIL